jgi:hypothetical protein
MNKKIIIILVAMLFLISGIVYFMGNRSVKDEDLNETKSVFTSIKDAMSKDVSLVCEFSDEKGMSTKSYIKNGAVRVSTSDSSNSSSEIIMKDKKMYMWDMKTKTGFIYEVEDSDEGQTNQVGMTGSEVVKSEQYLDMIEKYKDSCKVATVEDSYFTPPTDVNFQDMSKFLEDLQKQMPQIPQQ